MTPYCADDIKSDEGCRLKAYQDTVGVWTCGYGHAGVPAHTAWSQPHADQQFLADFHNAIEDLDQFLGEWWRRMNDARQDVLVNMTFNLGIRGVIAFKNALSDMRNGDYDSAAQDMLSSVWARQLPRRSARLSKQMATGVRVGLS